METQQSQRYDWYAAAREYTLRLVGIRSVSPGSGERSVAEEVLRIVREGGLEDAYTALGLDPIPGDLHGRANAYAFLRGASPRTVVLLGHIDTVGTADYGALEPFALDPLALAARHEQLAALAPELRDHLTAYPDDVIAGRGVVDMKSGVAANIAVMRRLAQEARNGQLPISVVVLATPDEENESAGVLQAVRFLLRLRDEYRLEYVGAINTDYTTSRYAGDPHRYIYTGTVGKLLPSFLVIGREAHVGVPFDGLDANLLAAELIGDLSMNPDLCDVVRDQVTPPPVTLHAADLKDTYNVQLAFAAHFYLNVLTFTTSPGELLDRLRLRAEAAMTRVLARVDTAERQWREREGRDANASQIHPRTGLVLTYHDLYSRTVAKRGEESVRDVLAAEMEALPSQMDARERSLHLVRRLWTLGGLTGPAVVLYYSPPYYPHVAASPCALHNAVRAVASAHPDLNLTVEEFYPYISDMSYLRLDPGADLTALTDNLPQWRDERTEQVAGSYSLPLDAIARLNLPIVNLGPYGWGVHQASESMLMSYSFGALPQLVYETVARLGEE